MTENSTGKKAGSVTRSASRKRLSAAEPALPTVIGTEPEAAPLFIAGIGSSAGGLEAAQLFFRNLPADSGIAFVLIPHLSPEHKGLLPDLLQHDTVMKVVQAADGMAVEANHVYIIPPNKNISILHGALLLLDFVSPAGTRMPIDFFFRHLAEDQGENAIGIVLSGTGTDGTFGIAALKEHFGLTIAQDLHSARYDGMPRSAIDSDLIDYVLPVEEIPAKLIEYVRRAGLPSIQADVRHKKIANALEKICALLREHTGNDFTLYKSDSLMRRITRRMSVHQIDDISHYVRYIQDNPQELDLFYKELLIGVTGFFRDVDAFELLRTRYIPSLLNSKTSGEFFRAWIPACSTGEEAYSFAILLCEALEERNLSGRVKTQIFATDVDEVTIEKARLGVFSARIATDVSRERLERFFVADGTGYTIRKEIREMVVFAPQNLLSDPPFTRLDLLSCRNLLIYLNPETQAKLIPLFHYALNPGGLLFMGTSETIGDQSDMFDLLNAPNKIYRRTASYSAPLRRLAIPSAPTGGGTVKSKDSLPLPTSGTNGVLDLTQRMLMEDFMPPAVLVTDKGEILYICGKTGKYLELPVGKASMNLFVMAREGLRLEIGTALFQAVKQQKDVVVRDIRVKTNGDYQLIDLTIRPIKEPEALLGLYLVVFQAVEPRATLIEEHRTRKPRATAGDVQIAALKVELQACKEHLQSVIEQIDTSREEIQAANEELQSANEEMQSTNEELETSREEMQSLNEELQTVNAELTTKNSELLQSYDDMKNLLNGTEIATVFLDSYMKIRWFTPAITPIVKLIPGDIGRAVSDISFNLKYDSLEADLHTVMETHTLREVQVQSKSDRWYELRIMPYLTTTNTNDGVVITFMDITVLKQLETALVERETVLQVSKDYSTNIISTLREPFMVLHADMKIISANRAFYVMFQTGPIETEGRSLYSLNDGKWDIPDLKKLLEVLLPQHTEIRDLKIQHDFPVIGVRVIAFNAKQIVQDGNKKSPPMIMLAMEDITHSHNLKNAD